jgi:hypothetical protein
MMSLSFGSCKRNHADPEGLAIIIYSSTIQKICDLLSGSFG